MSKLGKTILIGVSIIVIGVILLVTALAINGWKLDSNYEMKVYDCSTEINSINLDFETGTLKTQFYDGEKIKIEYPENRSLITTIAENDGTLSIVTDKKFNLFQFKSLFQNIPEAIISIPQGSALNLNFKINAGKVEIASGNYGNICLELNAGEINLGDINCNDNICNMNAGKVVYSQLNSNNNNIKLNAGTLLIKNMNCNDFKAIVNAGNIDINNINCQSLDMKVNAGDIDFDSCVCKNLAFDMNAGNIKVNSWFGDILKLDVDAGSINVGVDASKADYSIQVNKTTGNCNLQNQIAQDSVKLISVDLDSGNVSVNFRD